MGAVADYWWWFSAAAVLMVLEIVTPGVFFIWIGFGALATGLIDFVFPAASPALLGTIFAVLSVVSVAIGKKVMANGKQVQPDPTLNNRAAQYIGQIYSVCEPIVAGRGKISVGDSQWLATAQTDIPANARVKVTGARGTTLEVEPVNDG